MNKMSQLRDMGARIRARREEMGMSQEMLAEKVGYKSRSSINKIELGKNDIVQSTIKKIADALSTTPAYLMGWEDTPTPPAPNLLPAPTMVRKPRLGRVACGQPILAEEHIDGYDLVPEEIKCDFTLVCKGDSMINARIFDGDIVCVRQQPEVENGEIAVVLVDDDEATLKRFYRYDDHIELRAENPSFRDKAFWDADMSRVRVIGRATHFIGEVR